MEKRIEAVLEEAERMVADRGDSAVAAIGYFSESIFNLRIVGLNMVVESAPWAGRLLRTIRRGRPVNGCWVQVLFARLGSADEIRRLICSKLEA